MPSQTKISEVMFKGHVVKVSRDHNGKYFVKIDDRITQRKLTSNEIVRYLTNAMQEETCYPDRE